MKAGELAKHFGISPKTIHWYEAQGLLPTSERTPSNYRNFSREALDQLGFVRKALAIGFSVSEIKMIMDARSNEKLPCDLVIELLDKKIEDTTKKLLELKEVESHLKQLKVEWVSKQRTTDGGSSTICPLIEKS